MEVIDKFVSQFTSKKIENLVTEGNRFYLVDVPLAELRKKISKQPYAIGLPLGEIKGTNFKPSIALLDWLSKNSDRKVYLNKKSAWLFICGRDVFGKGIEKANVKEGLVLVQNEADENLGYGRIVADLSLKDKMVIKNLLDKGDFLRRERN
jgi:ribosome biogenesis protein Nip4